jgi:hypothetical protein
VRKTGGDSGESRGEFQFKKRATAAEMSINHNQRNKFSLVSLHVCNINFSREHFYASNFFFCYISKLQDEHKNETQREWKKNECCVVVNKKKRENLICGDVQGNSSKN